MKRINPDDRLTEGWEASPSPFMGPNGEVGLPHKRLRLLPDPPSLCTQGPCVNYHEIKAMVEAAEPTDGSSTGKEHTQLIKTCYPNEGIEVDLNGAPVFECSLWSPIKPSIQRAQGVARNAHLKTPAGKVYLKTLAAWRAENKRLEDEAVAQASEEAAAEAAVAAHIAENEE